MLYYNTSRNISHQIISYCAGQKTKVVRAEGRVGRMYDTSQKDPFAGKNITTINEFLSISVNSSECPQPVVAPKYYEVVDSVLSSFSEVLINVRLFCEIFY